MKINDKEKYQVSGSLLNKLLREATEPTIRQIKLCEIVLLETSINFYTEQKIEQLKMESYQEGFEDGFNSDMCGW
jgi:hypothetical protein